MTSDRPIFNRDDEDVSGMNPTVCIVRVTYLGPVYVDARSLFSPSPKKS